ncbi:hypothetical protein QBC44DRAFT_43312 [Cladorrhinum sp. PSN332]|nr:hypothetical protein QBC44DRAFT_43312 [Cladorrhinum sp. PSN332]
MRFSKILTALAVMGSKFAANASTFTPTKPPAVPLAVRSPYLNAWLQGESGCLLPGNWPRHWTGNIVGWQGFVAVDGDVYNWMGAATGPPTVNQISLEYTSTRSIFTFDVDGRVTLTVTFLSPVYPDDLDRQSLQFSYISVKAQSSDNDTHSVQVYMDVTGEWASGNHTEILHWNVGNSEDITYLNFWRDNQTEFAEVRETAAWGSWYLATQTTEGLSHQIGSDTTVRKAFEDNQRLDSTVDENFRAVNISWPVFAFAHDLGDVSGSDEVERLFTLGITQDRVINFAGASRTMEPVPGLWRSYYANDTEAVTSFYNDYGRASNVSDQLDKRIHEDSINAAGTNYSLITTLALRQTFGALQYAGTDAKPYIFLKEISSNSDIQTVDVIFPAFPILVYLNPRLIKYLLEPLYENQESGAYPNAFAEHDLGTFPVAKGYPDGLDEAMPLEECGNMIIMSLAYAKRTGDDSYLSQHYPKLKQWAQFLVNGSLIPSNQLSTDDFAGTLANQTNLAIKGIIGLKAMSEIARLTNNTDSYSPIASSYLEAWKSLGIHTSSTPNGPPHTTLSYGDSDSHGLLYNIYADKLLGLNFIDQSIYDMQSQFYLTAVKEYGAPLDTRHTWAKSDWQMFAAAVASPETQKLFIDKLAHWIGTTKTNGPMTDLFDAVTGDYPSGGPTFMARPVVGAFYGLLALPK